MTCILAFKFSIVTEPPTQIITTEVVQELAPLSPTYLDVQEQLQRIINWVLKARSFITLIIQAVLGLGKCSP